MAEGLGPGSGPSPEVRAIAGAAAQLKAALWPGSAPRMQPCHCDRHALPRGSGRMGPAVAAWAWVKPINAQWLKF